MRPFTVFLFCLLLFLVNLSGCISEAAAGWGGGSCGPVGPSGYEWKNAHDGWQLLYRDGQVIAAYHAAYDQFHRWDGHAWLPGERAPWTQQTGRTRPALALTDASNFGVEQTQLGIVAGEHYKINGREVSKKEARDAIEAPTLPDDSGKLRLTIIGPDAERKTVLQDWLTNPAFTPLRDHFLVQDYPADHWAVARAGFVTTGKPTIYVQQASGHVLHRQDSYAGPEDLASAIRKADPDYKPAADPDLRKTVSFDFTSIPPIGWFGGILTLIVLFLRKKKT